LVPDGVRYSGEKAYGITVVNNIRKRGRRLGSDILDRVRQLMPMDLVGMGWEDAQGIGEVKHSDLPEFISHYRFFFNPIRYTSMPLAVCEAMMVGMPIVGLATTEMASSVQNGVSGFIDTNVDKLMNYMLELMKSRALANELSKGARRAAEDRFNIQRFVRDWNQAFHEVTS
jgi:glycosyltransferase involved in cell wall biosynthesis